MKIHGHIETWCGWMCVQNKAALSLDKESEWKMKENQIKESPMCHEWWTRLKAQIFNHESMFKGKISSYSNALKALIQVVYRVWGNMHLNVDEILDKNNRHKNQKSMAPKKNATGVGRFDAHCTPWNRESKSILFTQKVLFISLTVHRLPMYFV